MSRSSLGAGLRVRAWALAGAALLSISLGCFLPAPTGAAASGTPLYPCDNERIGFGVVGDIARYDVSALKAGWYVNWHAVPSAVHVAGLDFVQVIRVNDYGFWPSGADLNTAIERSPASLWLIGNEPDAPLQDNADPANYARVYHDAYQAIKARDPLASVAIGGMVQATPVRMKWLDKVWSEYQRLYGAPMPVDVWNIHTFLLREVRPGFGAVCAPPGATELGDWGARIPSGLTDNCGLWVEIDGIDRLDLFREQVVRFRTWMRNHGQQNKELIVSEYGILFPEEYGYTYTRVRDYMFATFDYFLSARDTSLGYPADDYHLVQRWAWYSLDDTSFEDAGTTYSALLNPKTGLLTALGHDFARFTAEKADACPSYVDLFPVRLRARTPSAIRYGYEGIVRLELEVGNRGTAASPATQVEFWQGDPAGGGVLLSTVSLAPVAAHYQNTAKATYDWVLPAQGGRTITVKLDAANRVAESREDNNTASTSFSFGTVNLAVGRASWTLVHGPLRPAEPTQLLLAAVPITLTQPAAPSEGIRVVPPPFSATWYDGNPDAGRVLAARSLPAPPAFGSAGQMPEQEWAPVMTAARRAWLVLALETDAPETSSGDNRVAVTVPATMDLQLTEVERTGGFTIAEGEATADVQLRFRVANAGSLPPSAPLAVAAWPGEAAVGPEIGRVPLAATGDWTEALTWADLPPGRYPFTARVDPDKIEPESDETNNDLAGVVLVAGARRFVPLAIR